MMQSYDLTIVGGGMVGLTLAASLANSALSVALIETNDRPTLPAKPANRVSAISFASRKIFENLGVWQQLDSGRITPYDNMLVWDKDSFGQN